MARPIARCVPTRRGRKYEPPVSGIRPSLQNGCRKLALSLAMTRSQASAKLQPAPAATPFTAAITGIGNARIVFTSGA